MRSKLFSYWPALTALLLFLAINTAYFWENSWLLVIVLALALVFIWLFVFVVVHLVRAIKERFSNRTRIFNIISVAACLLLVVLFPFGIIDFTRFESKDKYIFYREGVAGCGTTIKLKENGRFRYRSVCFGISKVAGTYTMSGDSVFFHSGESKFNFAVIRKPPKEKGGRNALDLYMPDGKVIPMSQVDFLEE